MALKQEDDEDEPKPRAIPAYLNGRGAEDWPGQWVRVPAGAHGGAHKDIEGHVTTANARRTDDGMVLYLTVTEWDGFTFPGIDARNVLVVDPPPAG